MPPDVLWNVFQNVIFVTPLKFQSNIGLSVEQLVSFGSVFLLDEGMLNTFYPSVSFLQWPRNTFFFFFFTLYTLQTQIQSTIYLHKAILIALTLTWLGFSCWCFLRFLFVKDHYGHEKKFPYKYFPLCLWVVIIKPICCYLMMNLFFLFKFLPLSHRWSVNNYFYFSSCPCLYVL